MSGSKSAVEQVKEKIIHVYDGIEEADNALPLWWVWLFYLTIVFAVGYWFAYHSFGAAPLPMAEYAEALEHSAKGGGEMSAELLVALSNDPAEVEEGRALFKTHCVACHEADGRGKIGPNLTDAYWIHGGGPVEIHATVSNGAPNGMAAWKGPLGPKGVQHVVAFVLTLRNTNVAGKAPQGALWTGESAAPAEPQPAGDSAIPADSANPATAR